MNKVYDAYSLYPHFFYLLLYIYYNKNTLIYLTALSILFYQFIMYIFFLFIPFI